MSLLWTPASTPTGVTFADVAWSPTLALFVAIQTTTGNDKFYSSPDGLVWTAHNYVSATIRPLHIAWVPGLGKFVATGSTSGSIHCGAWTSADGLDWSSFTADIIAGTVSLTGLTANPAGLIMQIGGVFSGGIFRYHSYTSTDGVTWTDHGQIDAVTNAPAFKVIWANALFYVALQAAGGTFGLASSADGVAWAMLGMSGITYPQNVGPIAYDPIDGRIAASYSFGGGGNIATSDDLGGAWTDQGAVSGSQLNIIWGNGIFLMFSGSEVAISADGITWAVDNTVPVVLNAGVYAAEIGVYVGVGTTDTQAAAASDAFAIETTPQVDAGPDKIVTGPLPGTVTTESVVTPGVNNGTLTYQWTQIAGPGLLVTAPDAPAIENVGAAGADTYSYRIVARGTSTDHSPRSAQADTATGNAALDGTNFNRLSGPRVVDIAGFDVYRVAGGATQGKIGSVPQPSATALGWTFDDTGLEGDGSTPPVAATAAPTIVSPTAQDTDLTFTEYVPAKYTFKLVVTTEDGIYAPFDTMQVFMPAAGAPSVTSGYLTLDWS